jgi:hypothetical protein
MLTNVMKELPISWSRKYSVINVADAVLARERGLDVVIVDAHFDTPDT